MEKPPCNICGHRHWKGEPHKFDRPVGPEAEPVVPSPKPKSGGAAVKGIAGLREAVLVAKGVTEPSRVTVVLRDREKQSAYMREWRRKKRLEKAGRP